MEYKIAKASEDLVSIAKVGLLQINAKQYYAKLKANVHVKKIIKIALAFCGKQIVLEYQID